MVTCRACKALHVHVKFIFLMFLVFNSIIFFAEINIHPLIFSEYVTILTQFIFTFIYVILNISQNFVSIAYAFDIRDNLFLNHIFCIGLNLLKKFMI